MSLGNLGHPSLWHAIKQRWWLRQPAAHTTRRGSSRGNPTGPACLSTVASQRGEAGPGAQGAGPGTRGRNTVSLASAVCSRQRRQGLRAQPAGGARWTPRQPAKGKARRAYWRVFLLGSCCPSLSVLGALKLYVGALGICIASTDWFRAGVLRVPRWGWGLGVLVSAAEVRGHSRTSGLRDNFARRSSSKFPLLPLS